MDDETSSRLLPNIVVELRNSSGKVIQTKQTNGSGFYSFVVPFVGQDYYVVPALDRMQVAKAQGASEGTVTVTAAGALKNFTVRGVLVPITVSAQAGNGSPGTYVALSPSVYSGKAPPPITAGSVNGIFSGVTGKDGTAIVKVAPNASGYQLTCWVPVVNDNGARVYERRPANGSTPILTTGVVANTSYPMQTCAAH